MKNQNGKEIGVTRVFKNIYETNKPIVVLRGGARSSKTYSMAQFLVSKIVSERNIKFLVCRKTMPSLKMTAMREVINLFKEYGFYENYCDHNRTDNVLTFKPTNSIVWFASVDDREKLKCFHPDTEVFTEEGFKNIQDVRIGDKISTLNPETGISEFKEVTKLFSYDYDGEMYSPASATGDRRSYTDFCVTPNHKILTHTVRRTEWELVRADKLPQTYFIKQGCSDFRYESKDLEYFEIPRIDFSENLTSGNRKSSKQYKQPSKYKNNKNGRQPTRFKIDSWLRFFGWYIAEGNISDDYAVFISQTKEEGRQKIRKDLEGFELPWTETNNGFVFYSKDMVCYLKQFGKSHEKFIPRELLNLPKEKLSVLLDSMVAGDGTITSENRRVYYTNSERLCENVFEIAVKLGLVPSRYDIDTEKYYEYKNKENARPCFAISLVDRDSIRLSNIKKENYSGKVYCIEVPPYHTVLTRFHGRIAWLGQSTGWNYIWMEEATDFDYEDFMILKFRLSEPGTERNQIFLSFNPISAFHWIKTTLVDKDENDEVEELVSTYKDNPYLSKDYIKIIEGSKKDENYWKVYGLGEWGSVERIIYNRWELVDEFPEEIQRTIWGLDFGFNAPSALIEVGLVEDGIFLKEHLYKKKLTNAKLIGELKRILPSFDIRLYADSAEPNRIREIKTAGISCKPASKGPNSIKDGIDFIKSRKLYVTKDSVNLIKELQGYQYKRMRDGTVVDEPSDTDNHLLDAARYAIFSHYGKKCDLKLVISGGS